MDFITILNEIVFPIFGYSILGFISVYGVIFISKAVKSVTDNTARLIVSIEDADKTVGDQVKNVFTTIFNEFMGRRNNDDI